MHELTASFPKTPYVGTWLQYCFGIGTLSVQLRPSVQLAKSNGTPKVPHFHAFLCDRTLKVYILREQLKCVGFCFFRGLIMCIAGYNLQIMFGFRGFGEVLATSPKFTNLRGAFDGVVVTSRSSNSSTLRPAHSSTTIPRKFLGFPLLQQT